MQITAMIAAKLVTAIASVVSVVALVRIIHGFLSDRRIEESSLSSKTNHEQTSYIKPEQANIPEQAMENDEDDGMFRRLLTNKVQNISDRHLILHTTMVELARALNLEECVIWMPKDNQPFLGITHSIKLRQSEFSTEQPVISLADETVQMVLKEFKAIRIPLESELAEYSCARTRRDGIEIDYVFAVRLPLLNISTFCCELLQPKTSTVFAIIVLVVPKQANIKWGGRETAIVEAAVDQVIVALSHVTVMEESLIAREDLKQRIIALEFSKQELENSMNAQNDLITVISHEMRTRLQAIGTLSSSLLENLDEGQKYRVGIMQRSGKVIYRLMDELLGISTLENDDLCLNSDRIILPELIRVAEILLEPAATSKGLRLFFSGDKNLPKTVVGDEIRILHVFLSIVGNAIKFTERGNEIYISTEFLNDTENGTESANGELTSCSYIHFEVKNTGIGIDTPISYLLFNKFDEEHSGIATSGIGFSNSEDFLKFIKGKIWIESEGAEQGTTCHFRFQVEIVHN